jgi:hypothetical protein
MKAKIIGGFLAGVLVAAGVAYLLTPHSSTAPESAPAAAVATPNPAPAVEPPAPAAEAPPVEAAYAKAGARKKAASLRPAPEQAAEQVVEQQTPPELPPAAAPPPEPPQSPPQRQTAVSLPVLPPPQASSPPPPSGAAVLAPVPAPAPPHTVTIPADTALSVRISDGLSTKTNHTGDAFSGTLDQPLVVEGFVIADRGARVQGRIAEAEQAGRVKGLARLSLELTGIDTSDGQKIAVHTAQFDKTGPQSKGEDAGKIGFGAVLGTLIGAAAGGGKGAAIGAAAGGGAGTGTVLATRGKPAEIKAETLMGFKLDQPVTVTEHFH